MWCERIENPPLPTYPQGESDNRIVVCGQGRGGVGNLRGFKSNRHLSLCASNRCPAKGSVFDCGPERVAVISISVEVVSSAFTALGQLVDATIDALGEIVFAEVCKAVLHVLFRRGCFGRFEEHARCLPGLFPEQFEEFLIGFEQ